MKIFNAKVFIGNKFIEGGIDFDDKFKSCGEGITDGDVNANGAYIIPGLVDIHTHAAVDADASDGDADGMQKMSKYYASGGVTSWCPTTMTLKEHELIPAMNTIRDFVRPANGAKVAGIHMEGPFVSMAKRGAQNPDNIHVPDAELFKRLNDASGGLVRVITMACEEPGALEAIAEISKYCTVSIGHTTSDYDTAKRAYDVGATHLTHLFNAMPSLLHRDPGVIAAAYEAGATAEIITDGIHVHPAMIRIARDLFGKNLVLISDSLRCAGMPDGDYTLGGQDITMKDGKATLTGTDTIAGSSIHLMEGVRRSVSFGIKLEDAVYAATTAPARAINMSDTIGSIEKGKSADFCLLDKDLNVTDVYINGERMNYEDY